MKFFKFDDQNMTPDVTEQEATEVKGGADLRTARTDTSSGIVFVGGWGSSSYQYDFPGDY